MGDGRSSKTARFLETQRRGRGRTNRYSICVDGVRVFAPIKPDDTTFLSCPDATSVSHHKPDDTTFLSYESYSNYSQSISDESCVDEQQQQSPGIATANRGNVCGCVQAKPSATTAPKPDRRPLQDVQNKLVSRLGLGDIASGWEIFGSLDGYARQELESLERDGALTDEEVEEYR